MLPLQGAQVQSLVGEPRSHMLQGVAKTNKQTKREVGGTIILATLSDLLLYTRFCTKHLVYQFLQQPNGNFEVTRKDVLLFHRWINWSLEVKQIIQFTQIVTEVTWTESSSIWIQISNIEMRRKYGECGGKGSSPPLCHWQWRVIRSEPLFLFPFLLPQKALWDGGWAWLISVHLIVQTVLPWKELPFSCNYRALAPIHPES